jgi:hypothetical protein
MTSHWQDWPPQVLAALRKGVVIPAHPLALNAGRKLDTRRQRALTRYYLDAGAGGLAVGVHTTQFTIREAGLFDRARRWEAGQKQEIDRVCAAYPQLNDDAFVRANLQRWLS